MENSVISSTRRIVSVIDTRRINQRPNRGDVIFHAIFTDQSPNAIQSIREMFSFDSNDTFSMKISDLKMMIGIRNNDIAVQVIAYKNRELYSLVFRMLFGVMIQYITPQLMNQCNGILGGTS